MTDKTRLKIAAIVTALFLAGISTAGLAARSDSPERTSPSAVALQTPTAAKTSVGSSAQSMTEREGYDDEPHGEREDHD